MGRAPLIIIIRQQKFANRPLQSLPLLENVVHRAAPATGVFRVNIRSWPSIKRTGNLV